PWYANYTKDPLGMPLTPPPPAAVATMPPLIDPAPAEGQPAQLATADPASVPAPEPLPESPVALAPSDPVAPNGGGN
ncbi:hypothetical protein RND15_52810, partial [Streptomyces sp. DSM 41529]|nr:hypothetical protein [Streptomyces sp. DSM 41529]